MLMCGILNSNINDAVACICCIRRGERFVSFDFNGCVRPEEWWIGTVLLLRHESDGRFEMVPRPSIMHQLCS